VIGFLLVLYLSYVLAISKTVETKREFLALQQEEQQFNNLSQQLFLLRKKEHYLDSTLQSLNLGNTSMENNLLRRVNQEAEKHQLKVMDFNPPHVYNDNGTVYKTFHLVLRGTFLDILKAIQAIEQQGSFGEVAHIEFTKQKNYRTSQNYLEATIFIQKLE